MKGLTTKSDTAETGIAREKHRPLVCRKSLFPCRHFAVAWATPHVPLLLCFRRRFSAKPAQGLDQADCGWKTNRQTAERQGEQGIREPTAVRVSPVRSLSTLEMMIFGRYFVATVVSPGWIFHVTSPRAQRRRVLIPYYQNQRGAGSGSIPSFGGTGFGRWQARMLAFLLVLVTPPQTIPSAFLLLIPNQFPLVLVMTNSTSEFIGQSSSRKLWYLYCIVEIGGAMFRLCVTFRFPVPGSGEGRPRSGLPDGWGAQLRSPGEARQRVVRGFFGKSFVH